MRNTALSETEGWFHFWTKEPPLHCKSQPEYFNLDGALTSEKQQIAWGSSNMEYIGYLVWVDVDVQVHAE